MLSLLASVLQMFTHIHADSKLRSVVKQIQPASPGGTGSVKLADMTFSEIVKADRLKDLKKDGELYKQKFFEAYGKYPA